MILRNYALFCCACERYCGYVKKMPLFILEMHTELFRSVMTLYLGFALKCFRGKKKGWRGREMKEIWQSMDAF